MHLKKNMVDSSCPGLSGSCKIFICIVGSEHQSEVATIQLKKI